MNEKIILIHGLGRTSTIFSKMENYLKKNQHDVLNFNYPSRRFAIADLSDQFLQQALTDINASQYSKLHFVGHSLGSILIRYYLQGHRLENLGRIVMIAPPNHGSELAEKLRPWTFYKWLMGPAGQQLGVGPESVPKQLGPLQADFGVIAGTRSANRLFSLVIPGIDDGKVSVESAKLEGMRDFLEVPCGHAFIVQDSNVIQQTEFFIQHGKFNHLTQ